jgi:hypothetical protein
LEIGDNIFLFDTINDLEENVPPKDYNTFDKNPQQNEQNCDKNGPAHKSISEA